MSFIKWRDTYNTGIEQFDLEHHKLIELIDVMYCATRDNGKKEVILKACDEILEYTNYHFINEETVMISGSYPFLEEHVKEHTKLKLEAERFHATISSSFPEGTAEFYQFLRDWLINHILDCDMKYVPFLKDSD